jgi:tetrahydromethanopterin S-methyltransferase subunit B
MGPSTDQVSLERRVDKLESDVAAIEPLTDRIKELEALVEKLRRELDELTGEPPGPKWHRSGSINPELDDQTIAPA